MPQPKILIGHNDPEFILIVSQLAEEIGYQARVETDGRQFQRAYEALKPQIILYEFLTEYFDGIELTQWLIQQSNEAKVIITTSRRQELTKAAEGLAKAANLFSLSILHCPASPDEIMSSLKA